MKKKVATWAFVILTLAGCAPRYVWVRPDTSDAQYAQDAARCEYEAASSTANYGSNPARTYTLGQAIGQGVGAGLGKAVEQNSLITLCMKAKGYRQTGVEYAQAPRAYIQQNAAQLSPLQAPVQQPSAAPEQLIAGAAPPGAIQQTMYYQPYPGAAPVPVPPPGGPVEPEFTVRGEAPRVASAPAVGAGVKGESIYMFTAEQLAKAQGCRPPAATMTTKGAGQESFAVACPNGNTMAMLCGVDGCRILR